MKTRILLSTVFLLIFSTTSLAFEVKTITSVQFSADCKLRVVTQSPPKSVKTTADVLFFTGFADRADNHGPLFQTLSEAGLRVISFDYPSHGQTNCGSINYKDFGDLAKLALEVEKQTREDAHRPLVISGWSTGGLLALRASQTALFDERFVLGLVLLAPGIFVHPLVGDYGVVTQETLLSNPKPPHFGEIKPTSPLKTPLFAAHLLINAKWAAFIGIPSLTPTLLIMAGDAEDKYVKTAQLKNWFYQQRNQEGTDVIGVQCAFSKHELDNELITGKADIGAEVRMQIKSFISQVTDEVYSEKPVTVQSGTFCHVLK